LRWRVEAGSGAASLVTSRMVRRSPGMAECNFSATRNCADDFRANGPRVRPRQICQLAARTPSRSFAAPSRRLPPTARAYPVSKASQADQAPRALRGLRSPGSRGLGSAGGWVRGGMANGLPAAGAPGLCVIMSEQRRGCPGIETDSPTGPGCRPASCARGSGSASAARFAERDRREHFAYFDVRADKLRQRRSVIVGTRPGLAAFWPSRKRRPPADLG
jgi:hypothetical protein